MKKIFAALFVSFIISQSYCQDVKLKKGKIFINGKAILSYKKQMIGVNTLKVFTLNPKKEILYIVKDDNQTSNNELDNETRIKFVQQNKEFVFHENRTYAEYLTWLIKEKVLNSEGKINVKNIDTFMDHLRVDIKAEEEKKRAKKKKKNYKVP